MVAKYLQQFQTSYLYSILSRARERKGRICISAFPSLEIHCGLSKVICPPVDQPLGSGLFIGYALIMSHPLNGDQKGVETAFLKPCGFPIRTETVEKGKAV